MHGLSKQQIPEVEIKDTGMYTQERIFIENIVAQGVLWLKINSEK